MRNSVKLFITIVFLFSSCVTPKIHNALIAEHEESKNKLQKQGQKVITLTAELEQKLAAIAALESQITKLKKSLAEHQQEHKILGSKYEELSKTYDLLVSKNSRYIADKAKETKKLLEQLEDAELELLNKEKQLNNLSNSLAVKQEELTVAQSDLELRSQRVYELETIINKKDSIVSALKQSISKALTGLEGEGLTVVQKEGKVYISLEESLLFASGKYEVNNNGVITLNKLSSVLANQKDLEILIEGHTDSVPLSGKGFVKDNWDLSVMRATNVVKVLTQNNDLNPTQLIAAGRSKYIPIQSNKTSEGRMANRRIEMIISPNLDDLFQLLD